MNPSFAIQTPGIEMGAASLLVKIGNSGLSYVIADDSGRFTHLFTYSGAAASPDQLKAVIDSDELLQAEFRRISIVWDFEQALSVPEAYNNAALNTEMVELIYGNAISGRIRSDYVPAQRLHEVYKVPAAFSQALPENWQYLHQTHAYSLLLESIPATGAHLQVIFSANQLTAVLSKDGRLQIVQQFGYNSANDAAYYLLNICESFSVNPEEVQLHLGGTIDARSELYDTLHKYFLQLEFDSLPEGTVCSEAFSDLPAHYFAHLIAFSQCV